MSRSGVVPRARAISSGSTRRVSRASAGLDESAERLVHLTGPATVRSGTVTRDLPPAHTLALAPGESATVTGEGEILVLAALKP